MKYTDKLKKIIAMGTTVVLIMSVLSGCGKDENGTSQTSSPSNSMSSELTAKYGNYIDSFAEEVGEFINGDMDTILNGVADLNENNLAEWKAIYESGYASMEHWYSEVSAAEMLCSEENLQAHKDLTQTVGTIYKILEGLEDRVAAAENGDFSELESKAEDYKQADEIAHAMWERALSEVKQ